MNRRQKIIVSVVGIFIVLLALVGITYGYFLTRIQGNTNTTSVRVTTKDLELLYGDGTNQIITKTNILPGDVIGTKDFTVTNNGGDTSYVVVIEDVSVTYAADGTTRNNVSYSEGDTTTFISNDFVYTLTCISNIEGNTCNEQSFETSLPMKDGIILGNNIVEDEIHTYNLTVTYKETGEDQTDDMNKKLSAKVNIEDIKRINPYSDNENSLAYNIINNSMLNKNGTELVATSPTKVAEEVSAVDLKKGVQIHIPVNLSDIYLYGSNKDDIESCYSLGNCNNVVEDFPESCSLVLNKYVYILRDDSILYVYGCDGEVPYYIRYDESVLSATQDDYGTSYYYRGNVQDNFVTFANMCWRIVRVEGDGSVKLILEDQDQPCSTSINGNWAIPTTSGGTTFNGNYGYTQYAKNTLTASDGTKNSSIRYLIDYLHGQTNSASSMATAFKNFQNIFSETELTKLKAGNWCLADKGYSRIENPDTTYKYTVLKDAQKYDNKVKGISVYYDSYVTLYGKTLKEPTLKCDGTIMSTWEDDNINPTPMYVGTITADEVVYAGGKVYESHQDYYLINDEYKKSNNGDNKIYHFWTLSPNYFGGSYDDIQIVSYSGRLDGSHSNQNRAFRPAVSLASSAVISSGEGTIENPYIVAE